MKSFVLAALFATVQSAHCEDDNTKNQAIILAATQAHYDTEAALKTAAVTQYETDVKTYIDDVTAKTTARDTAISNGEIAAKAAKTTVMPAAEATAVTAAEAALKTSTDALTNFKTANAASQTILDNIAAKKLALDKAILDNSKAIHRCITATQKAHYDKKILAEKTMWGYDKMTDADKKIFDDYITKFVNYHQEQDAKMKETTEYYKMTDAEKAVYDKLESAMKEKDDYFDEEFDKNVKKEMHSAKFDAMTDDQKKEYLNKMRDDDFAKMKDKMDGDFIDLMAEKAMNMFDAPEDQQKVMKEFISKWSDTRSKAKDGVNLKMAEMMREKFDKFDDDDDKDGSQKMKLMEWIKEEGKGKMGEFLRAMLNDEDDRRKSGYFGMNEDDRRRYDSDNDDRRRYFERDDFFNRGWDERSGRSSQGGRGRSYSPGRGRSNSSGRGRSNSSGRGRSNSSGRGRSNSPGRGQMGGRGRSNSPGRGQMGGMNGQRGGMNGQMGGPGGQMGGMNGQRGGMNGQMGPGGQMGGMNGQRGGQNGQMGGQGGQMGGMNGQRGGQNGQMGGMQGMFQNMMNGRGFQGQGNSMMSNMMGQMMGGRNGNQVGTGVPCMPQRGGGRGRSGCTSGMCCAMIQGDQTPQCTPVWNSGINFKCLDMGAQNLVASAAAFASAAYLMM